MAALICLSLALLFSAVTAHAQVSAGSLGIFGDQTDIGSVTPPGLAAYDPAQKTYTLRAAGANIWATSDAFHFVWKKISGDVELTADVTFSEASARSSPHRKAVLMFRQSLDSDAVYADAAQHGVGLTGLQYRVASGETTQDIELSTNAPRRLRIEKRGDTITMFASEGGGPLRPVGASIKVALGGSFYAGIGLCSHDADVVESAVFSHVELKTLPPATSQQTILYSTLETIQADENTRMATVAYTNAALFQAPNWSKDGSSLVFNQDGRIWRVAAKGGTPEALDIGAATKCNGSHGFSPDGKWLAITCAMPDKPEARVYLIPASGGTPRLVTENPYSYWHSWSPDGKTILFTRPNKSGGGGNIYAIPAEGGAETALTTGAGVNDDPDFSPDGQYVYFNSNRGGNMQIWRMRPDGSGAEQMTSDEFNNWTPHPSPDGKMVVFMSYDKTETGHPANKDIALRILSLSDGKIWVLAHRVGGSGTINVPSWAPDSRHLAFVSYQILPPDESGDPASTGGKQ
jgi:hypothetical protein